MAGHKFYAIAKGKVPGIYTTWSQAKQQVDSVAGARYKSFPTRQEAQAWLDTGGKYQTQVSANAATSHVGINRVRGPQPDEIVIYSDGGSRNTGNVAGGHVRDGDPAAWAYLVQTPTDRYFDSQGEFGATNNKMELTGLLTALRALVATGKQQESIVAVLDSKYVLDAITKRWLAGWQRRGWRKSNGEVVANQALWQAMSQVLPQFKQLRFEWTKGHADNRGNVFVDELLNRTMDAMSADNPTGKHDGVQPLAKAQSIVDEVRPNDHQLDLF
ncbi:ribonuclease H family protein [Furfurilactobacillus curtus]|uniref:ribonuclease H n=1 Tax=Furfurilactobacillus curtus TaxID=1746200 RepID=A0ABQ5JSV2_9LACO